MTAEMAIMNKSAIALAADSAVTSSGGKIYNSVNKLFTLSKYFPVGVMIYGSAEVNSVPWETIIKIYRKNLGDRSFGTLKDSKHMTADKIDFRILGEGLAVEALEKFRYILQPDLRGLPTKRGV